MLPHSRLYLYWLLAIGLATGVNAARAAQVPGLYQASVPVADQSIAERDRALQLALTRVLVRVTGTRNPVQSGAIQPILARVTSLVQGYGYERPDPTSPVLWLNATFDAKTVETAVRNQGLPVWGGSRPSHLIWVSLRDDGGSRALLDESAVRTRAGTLVSTAEIRGVPLSFPRMDSADQRALSFGDIWTDAYGAVLAASRRYNPDQALVARVGRDNGRWLAHWTLLDMKDGREEWSTSESTLEQTLAEGMHALADREAARYATRAGGLSPQDLLLEVSGVQSLNDYSRALNYLRGLNSVRGVTVDVVAGTAVIFRLRLDGDANMLARGIAAGSVLHQAAAQTGTAGVELSYVLAR